MVMGAVLMGVWLLVVLVSSNTYGSLVSGCVAIGEVGVIKN